MPFKEGPSIPESNTLPLNIKESEKLAEHGESTVWKVNITDSEKQERVVALKQVRKEEFATVEAMQADRNFYKALKDSSLGKFVPDTLHFIAQVTPEHPAQGFRIQHLIDGKPIDEISDEELYRDPAVVCQLLEFTNGATEMLQSAQKEKTYQPDFRRAPDGRNMRAAIGGLLSDPRYTKNIVIANEADEHGQRVFFVDTGVNAQERTVKREELLARYVVNPLERLHLKRWKRKLNDALDVHKRAESAGKGEVRFREQWEHPERQDIEGEEVYVYDIKPDEEIAAPVVFVPGFGGTPPMFKRDIDTFVEHGRRVVSVDAPHGIEHDIPEDHQREFPDAELRKVAALVEVLQAKGIEKVNGVGNSEGSLVLVLAAVTHPELFDNLVLENTPGMIGEDDPLSLAMRFALDIATSEGEARRKKVEKQESGISVPEKASSRASFQSLYQSFQEVRAMSKTQILDLLREIKEKGIGVSIIHSASDRVFPMEQVQQMVKGDMVDGFYSVAGSHAQVRTKREVTAYTELAEYALATMEKKKFERNVERIPTEEEVF
jgi:pimeloyl-ACP methyl ester carboxylesterase